MRAKKSTTCLMLCLLWLSGVASGAAAYGEEPLMRTVIYPIVFGDPVALEEISRSIVNGEGHVVLDAKGNRLMVVTSEARHQQLSEVLGEADAKTDNVQITVRFRGKAKGRDQELSVQGGGRVVFGESGSSGAIVIRPEVRDTLTEASEDTQQMLLVASGREGVLKIGESVPYIEWISEYGWRGGYTESKVQWQEVGSFLVVTPTILSDGKTVHIRLTPELRGLVDGNPYRVKFAGLSTDVVVQDGATMPIGGLSNNQDFYARFLVGVTRAGAESRLDIELTPRIVAAGVRP